MIKKKQDRIDYNLTIDTDKAEYRHGETITISGRVTIQQLKEMVSIKLKSPNGLECWSDQINPEPNGSYSFSKIIRDDFNVSGQYNVIIKYDDIIEETTFTIID